jgi:hypothetical protein
MDPEAGSLNLGDYQCLFDLLTDEDVTNHKYVSYWFWYFESSLSFKLTSLRPACTLIHLNVCRQVSTLDQLVTIQLVIINNHGTAQNNVIPKWPEAPPY